jgi:hypothetical protein
VKLLLGSPGVAGLRRHGDTYVNARWPGILERQAWEAVNRLLDDPSRNTSPGPKAAHLLSGKGVCAGCSQPMGAKSAPRGQPGFVYRCTEKGCTSHSTIAERMLDEYVAEHVVKRLSRRDAVGLFARPVDTQRRAELLAERDDLDRRDAEVAGLFADGAVTAAQLARVTAATLARRETVDAELAAVFASTPVAGLPRGGDKVRAWWRGLEIERRRAVVDALMTVTVSRSSKPGARVLDPKRVHIDWTPRTA